jgi:hypothetical protein
VLVPIEARRFPEAPFSDEKSASGWVVACVISVLSERGLSFEDRGLLRAMLSNGTLAIAIDGLNEVAREQAVVAFAAEFHMAPMLVTSQESAEFPFEVWHLPGTISEHVDGLLNLYLGEQKARAVAVQLRESGLIRHLRSGYDVRLVIELGENTSEGEELPRDNTFLFNVVEDPMERANLKDQHKDIYEGLEAEWFAWNATMLPEIDESFTHSFSGAELADHIGTPKATGKADNPTPQASHSANPH